MLRQSVTLAAEERERDKRGERQLATQALSWSAQRYDLSTDCMGGGCENPSDPLVASPAPVLRLVKSLSIAEKRLPSCTLYRIIFVAVERGGRGACFGRMKAFAASYYYPD